jgi:hypothetical protein
MRIASATIVTTHLTSPTNAVKSLVDNNSIAGLYIVNSATDLFDGAADFVTKNLRLQREWNGQTVIVEIVVCVTCEDVRVGTANSDRRNSH